MKTLVPRMPLTGLLSLTKAQFHAQYSPSLGYNNLTVGAIIFKPSTANTHRLLLLKRAAHDHAFPGMFAIPGGHVEDTDLSIFHGLKREVLEETTMLVQGIIDQIDPLVWVTTRSVQKGESNSVTKSRSLQITFVCEVEGLAFQVDPEEHSMGIWADREEAEKVVMSTGMRRVVENAFKWKEAELQKGLKL
ncbi:hypothetical protein HO133_001989 [Letharia lupina]|uniref:Nudix hydrolase domain-containing protein n=1 Tax=Letharia lupina TaxID=560253 RepID=A0A8H6FBH2_9LECA|nr:uncharacterized protein HO133_001989 [Letharia lupina]KAF6222021.1 hypothetical protein HO133_001989 [Letharia lupina]